MKTIQIQELTFTVRPSDAGQHIEVAYAADWESERIVRRTRDEESNVTYAVTDWDGSDFCPWNNDAAPEGPWTAVRAR